MSLHLIELPDDLVAWLRAGRRGMAPTRGVYALGLRTAGDLIERAFAEPMECRTCRHWRSWRDGDWGECARPGIAEEFSTDPDDTCSRWDGTP